MPRFHFRLATLQKIREATREQRQREFAEAQRVQEMLQEQIQAIDRELEAMAATARHAAAPGPIDVDRLLDTQRYELLLKAQRQQILLQQQRVTEELEQRRQRLVEANREVRVLEKLCQRQAERFREEEEQRLRKVLDEVAQRRTALETTP